MLNLARSLIQGAKTVEDMLVEIYLDMDEEIRESERVIEFVVDVNGAEVIANIVPSELGAEPGSK